MLTDFTIGFTIADGGFDINIPSVFRIGYLLEKGNLETEASCEAGLEFLVCEKKRPPLRFRIASRCSLLDAIYMPFVGESFSLLCAVAWALAIIYFRVAGASVPALELNLIKNSLAMLMLLVTWAVLWCMHPGLHAYAFTSGELWRLVLSGLMGITIADTLLLRSLSLIGASRNAVLSCLFSPFVILIAMLFLGERFGWMQWIGFAIVIFGTLLVTMQKTDMSIDPATLKKGSLLGILSVFFIAVGMTITKPIVNDASAIATAAVRMTAGTIGSIGLIFLWGRASKSLSILRGPLPWKAIVTSTFLGSYLALILWIAGFKLTSTSTASVLNQTSVLFTLVFAVLILKEPMNLRKILGACFGFAGVSLIFLTR